MGKNKKPCSQCPYTLGLVETVVNPCPQCMLNNYKAYEEFRKHLNGEEMERREKENP